MSKVNLKDINFHDNVRSKPVRENFYDIEKAVNQNVDDIASLATGASGSEIAIARDMFNTIYDRLRRVEASLGDGIVPLGQIIDDCSTVTGWAAASADAGTPQSDTSDFLTGQGSVSLSKTGTSSNIIDYEVDAGSINPEDGLIYLNTYVADISEVYYIEVRLEDSTGNTKNFRANRFVDYNVGWSRLQFDFDNPTSETGTWSGGIDTYTIRFNTNSASTLISVGDLKVDLLGIENNSFKVREQATPVMSVLLDGGSGVSDGYGLYEETTQTSGTITAPSTFDRIDVVVMTQSGGKIIQGTEAADPERPHIPSGALYLADIYLRQGSTSIHDTDQGTDAYIIDRRSFIELGKVGFNETPHLYVDPNGKTSFQTIQSAVNFAKVYGGANIYILSGTYTENLDINAANNVRIQAIGDVTVTNTSGVIITIQNSNYITIDRVNISGGGSGVVGLEIHDSTYISSSRSKIENTGDYNIRMYKTRYVNFKEGVFRNANVRVIFENPSASDFCFDTDFFDCNIEGDPSSLSSAIDVYGAKRLNIERSLINYGGSDDLVIVDNSVEVFFKDNRTVYSTVGTPRGIVLEDVEDVYIENWKFDTQASIVADLAIENGKNIYVKDCEFDNGVLIQPVTASVTVENVNISGGTAENITVNSSVSSTLSILRIHGVTISNNINVTSLNIACLAIDISGKNVIANDIDINNGSAGTAGNVYMTIIGNFVQGRINAFVSSSMTISSNIVPSASPEGIYVTGNTNAIVTGNRTNAVFGIAGTDIAANNG